MLAPVRSSRAELPSNMLMAEPSPGATALKAKVTTDLLPAGVIALPAAVAFRAPTVATSGVNGEPTPVPLEPPLKRHDCVPVRASALVTTSVFASLGENAPPPPPPFQPFCRLRSPRL
jgi:hypothetical protein